jgi:hypothetical protein
MANLAVVVSGSAIGAEGVSELADIASLVAAGGYEDGRVEKILENIETIGHNLKSHEHMNWDRLKKHILEIFNEEYKEYKKSLEDAN